MLIIFILLLTSFEAICYGMPEVYIREFKRHDVVRELEYWRGEKVDAADLDVVMKETLSYLRGNRKDLHIKVPISGEVRTFYQEDEMAHLADVRKMFILAIRLRIAALMGCLLIISELVVYERGYIRTYLSRGYLFSCGLILLLSLILGGLAATDFNKYFIIFHQIFFRQGNWQFDPRLSRMICIMPEALFADLGRMIFATFIALMVLTAVPAVLWLASDRSRRPEGKG